MARMEAAQVTREKARAARLRRATLAVCDKVRGGGRVTITLASGPETRPDRVERAGMHLVRMPVRLKPRDRLLVRSRVEVGAAALRPRRPASQQVVPKRGKCMHHRAQFDDVRRVAPQPPPRRSQPAALVRNRVLVPRVVRLRQYRRKVDVACVRRQRRAAGRVESALRLRR